MTKNLSKYVVETKDIWVYNYQNKIAKEENIMKENTKQGGWRTNK